ncbi:hypothetical protein ACFOUP_10105 [Belliella kenyensis]|uniref:Uncharacterized protein n=1 Tax=Belliella kenyensis TaxID=1472724 RepID=A0ABV8EMH1_9BACT|nr:hypothetical protein [Belliella kenyensis]MCH7403283.1 hypothetical protein [Belliella kenyensis]MDN3602924.1 hypothetical protein [Belliella kenyensis]
MMVGLLFFASCQELKEEPLAKEPESVEQKFDRLVFLGAVNKATRSYEEEARNSKKGKNFRSIYDSEKRIERYIGDIAQGFNTSDSFFNVIPETSWDAPFQGNVLANEAVLDKSSLSPRVRMHIDQFENAMNQIADRYEKGFMSENQVRNELKTICKSRGNIIKSDTNLSTTDRGDLSDAFYVFDEITDELSLILQDPTTLENGFIRTRFGRALVRTLLVAAITVAVVYTVGLAVPAIKLKSLYLGHKAGLAAVTTKTTVAGGKMYAALTYGLGKGMIGAVQKWDEEWKGLGKESIYAAVKVAW